MTHPNSRVKASIVADSISNRGIRLTTFSLRYWRPIHSELMTHRRFSRNAGSSRARPSQAIIDQVRDEPWGPIHWGKNQPGMQAHEELSELDTASAQAVWRMAASHAATHAQQLVDAGVHKQIVNRLLEPFTYIDVVVTATDFNNWYHLRDHPDAQPEIRELAQYMKALHEVSQPKLLVHGEWHLPFVEDTDYESADHFLRKNRVIRSLPSHDEINGVLIKVSTARCARVSYKMFDGTNTSIEKDVGLFDKLVGSSPLHASPTEHQATPDTSQDVNSVNEGFTWGNPQLHGNFTGWIQYRKTLTGEYVPG